MPPLVFSPQDPSTLCLGMQFVLKTVDGGRSWQEISPDLTGYGEQAEPEKPDPDKPRPPAITALSPSTVRSGVIWAGTSNRMVQLTRDGGKDLAKRFSSRIDRTQSDPLRRSLASRSGDGLCHPQWNASPHSS